MRLLFTYSSALKLAFQLILTQQYANSLYKALPYYDLDPQHSAEEEEQEFYIVLSYDENRQVVVREALLVQQQLNHR